MSERASTKGREFSQPVRVEGSAAFISLTQGREAVVDASDLPLLKGRRWCLRVWQGKLSYCAGRLAGERKDINLHRLLLNAPDGVSVDHIDGDGLNNRRSNLRLASTAQNSWNTGRYRNNTSGHKGVSWRADRQKWQVHIRIGGKRLSLGHYTDVKMAAAAYAEAARKYHGEFANIGDPEEAATAPNPLSEGREMS